MALMRGPLVAGLPGGWPGRVVAVALPWLMGGLLTAASAAAAHPPMGSTLETLASDASSSDRLAESAAPGALASAALVCLGVLTLPGALMARRAPRGATLGAVVLLLWSAGETALHSAHHLGDPAQAERCAASTAFQHLPGIDPEPGSAALERPSATAVVLTVAPIAAAPIVLDEVQARAPPAPSA
jgi:hypothetical protein